MSGLQSPQGAGDGARQRGDGRTWCGPEAERRGDRCGCPLGVAVTLAVATGSRFPHWEILLAVPLRVRMFISKTRRVVSVRSPKPDDTEVVPPSRSRSVQAHCCCGSFPRSRVRPHGSPRSFTAHSWAQKTRGCFPSARTESASKCSRDGLL
jgi:hypothetical protein